MPKRPVHDFWDDADTRMVQPYEATKTYLCPGCNRDIPPGTGHLVAAVVLCGSPVDSIDRVVVHE